MNIALIVTINLKIERLVKNRVILDDNIDAMNQLTKNSIDFMLWDPPYNTKRTNMMYKDKLSHSKWLSFMEVRLELAKKLLKDTGVIAVHIGYQELFRLGLLMDEIFGEDNRLGIINWECSYSPKNDSKGIPSTTDYVLIYAKNKNQVYRGLLPRTAEMDAKYKNPDGDKRIWCSDNLSAASGTKEYFYGIENPITGNIHFPPGGRFWIYPKLKAKSLLSGWGVEYIINKEGNCVVKNSSNQQKVLTVLNNGPWPKIYFGKDGNGRPMIKRYYDELKNDGRVVGTYWEAAELIDISQTFNVSMPHEMSSHNGEAKKMIKSIMGDACIFDTPKPLKLTERLIQMFCPKNGIVLDAFGGSATTAHAVLSLNAQGAHRLCIIIEQDQDIYHNITCERIKRVILGNWFKPRKDTVPLGNINEWEFINIK